MSTRRKKPRGAPQSSADRSSRTSAGPSASPVAGSAAQRAAAQSQPMMLVGALVVTAVFLFGYLHLLVLPQMTQLSGGFAMPDARVLGYGLEDVERLQHVMDADARGQLSFVHKTAGTLFPLAVLLASWAAVGLVMRRRARWLVLVGAAAFAVVDIVDNVLIDRLLAADAPSTAAVTTASTLTVTGWALLVVVGLCVLVSVLTRLFRRTVIEPTTQRGD
ncbi:hypothetical protein [Nesterenkonia sp. F]|uniref:hypothetical protein n=1 Tax=Nesterenkonia sp. F TaxID=795955 RepID=UPI000255CAF1|nr:hypothetical protein [Nesterenkonia sp. F]